MIGRLCCVLFACFAHGVRAEPYDGDVRLWNELLVQEWRSGDWRTYTWAEARWVDDASRFGTWLLQQRLYYQDRPEFQWGLGAAWIELRRDGGGSDHIARLEFEANPFWRLGDGDSLQLRNRLEPRWLEADDWDLQWVTRHRLRWTHRTAWLPAMERIEVANEVFVDWSGGEVFENRLHLANLFFRVTEEATVNVFLQARTRRFDEGDRWQHAAVIGLGYRWYPR